MIDFLEHNRVIFDVAFGLGTLLSVFVAILTLKEVIKQRESMYKPEIVIKSFLLSISKSPFFKKDNELLLYKVVPYNDFSVNYKKVDFSISKNYKLENVGFGPAKKIICEWDFDINDALGKIQKILPDQYFFLYLKEVNLLILKDRSNDEFHYSTGTKISAQEINYISPINISDHFHLHSIPEVIIFMHYLFLILKMNLFDKISPSYGVFEFENFPKPKLSVSYKDLNDKKIKKQFVFAISAINPQISENLIMDEEFGMLHFNPL